MTGIFRWIEARSAEELEGLIPGVLEEEQHVTLLVNVGRWRTRARFSEAVRSATALVADFDGTLIAGNHWLFSARHMQEAIRAEDRADVQAHFGEPVRSPDAERAFLARSVDRLARSGYTRARMRADAREAGIRSGTRELVASFSGRACVVSYGKRDFIDAWRAEHGVDAEVAAMHLRFDGEALAGCDPETAVFDGNKGERVAAFRHRVRADADRVLALGDGPTDRLLFDDRNVSVLVYPPHDPDAHRAELRRRALPALLARAGAVLVGDALDPLAALRAGASP